MNINHDGDCSIYHSDICDCGEFRRLIRACDLGGDSEVWRLWTKHLAAIDETKSSVHQQMQLAHEGMAKYKETLKTLSK